MAEVTLSKVSKSFGKTEVVHGIDLDIGKGEFVVLVGPSGCGKSTTLRMIAGLEEITNGEISIAGNVVNRVEPRDRNIAMVFQNYAIYPHMSVYKNIAFGLRKAKMAATDKDRKVRQVAGILDLSDLLERRPSALSGGQRQRVAIGRAMVRDPSVFLFDEPLSNLDAQLRAQMRLEIKKLHQTMGTTIVFVTHDQIEAMTLADRIVIMKDGHIQQIGTPTEVYQNPRNIFVARFIGSPSMNILEGVVVKNGGRARLKIDGIGTFDPPSWLGSIMEDSKSVSVGIRPDDLFVVDDSNSSDATLLQGQVQLVEPLGPETLVYAKVGSHDIVAKASGRNPPGVNETVSMQVKSEDLHLFDAGTGLLIDQK